MKVYEINPFIRYAQKIKLTKPIGKTLTYDHRLFYIEHGCCNIRINNIEYALQKGSVILMQSGNEYEFNINEQISLISINFDYTQKFNNITNFITPVEANYFDSGNILEKIKFSDADALNSPIVISCMYEMGYSLNKIVNEAEKNIMYANEFASVMLKETILNILRFALFTSANTYDKTTMVIQYIEENYSKDITNDELAEICGYHPYHLNRLMQKYVKTTAHKYLMNYRLKKSRELLVNTDLSVTEISDSCGFKSPYYFSNIFKEKFGISPLKYRKSQKNKI